MKLLKDERLRAYEHKYKAQAFDIMMVIGFIYLILDILSINLGLFKENIVIILILTGSLYVAFRLTSTGLASYSPIKGIHPLLFNTIVSIVAAIFFGLILMVRNTNLYLDGDYSFPSFALFLAGFIMMFILTEILSIIIYLLSKKKEEKDMNE